MQHRRINSLLHFSNLFLNSKPLFGIFRPLLAVLHIKEMGKKTIVFHRRNKPITTTYTSQEMEDEATVEQDIILKVYTKGINLLKDKILLGLSNSSL